MGCEPIVIQLRHGPFWNFSYVVGIPGADAMVIDPAWDVPAILSAARAHEMRITYAAVTHGHHDHVHGLAELVGRTGATVLAHEAERLLLAPAFGGEIVTPAHSDAFGVGTLRVQVLHTPGHTPGSVSIFAHGNVFTGDTLMTSSRGRHGAHPGASRQLTDSLSNVLASLPPETMVYPGHDAGATASRRLDEALAKALA